MSKSDRSASDTGPRSVDERALDPDRLRWTCSSESVPCESTSHIEPVSGVVAQDAAVDALRFGVETRAPGQNVFIRGLAGTGRATLVRSLMEEMRMAGCVAPDRCYVHNFGRPDRPRLITLPAGQGHAFRRKVDRMVDFIRDKLREALTSEPVRASQAQIEQQMKQRIETVTRPFEERIRANGLALAPLQLGPVVRPVVVPLIDGKPVSVQAFEEARQSGKLSEAEVERLQAQREQVQEELERVVEQVNDIRREAQEQVRRLLHEHARMLVEDYAKEIREQFASTAVDEFLKELVEDLLENRLEDPGEDGEDFTRMYRVAVISSHEPDEATCSIVLETAPTLANLLGAVDREVGFDGRIRSSHMMIRAGSLLSADRGFLILEASEVLSEPGSWKVLNRTLKTGRLEIVPSELSLPWAWSTMTPEPIDVDLKVILIGDHRTFALLDAFDPDFRHLYKVLVDFDTEIARDPQGVALYAGVLARVAREEGLPGFERGAVGALVEHGARIASSPGKLTTRFGRVADIAREAAHVATGAGRSSVTADDVHEAVRRSKRRADLPSRKFREAVRQQRIRLRVEGRAVGQINGLAIIQAGQLTYGFPARISATIGPGTAGLINIEREAALSGAIHTKGFYILGGVLRTLLRTDHPLAFNASIAFEQSYGGIDGDSASAAEVCCLLSALTEVPLRQDIAMTGAVDQHGDVLAVGGVNEKIEGFFDVCAEWELTGTQGVIIPEANAGELMLRRDVVDAVRAGRFRVYTASTIHDALEVLTGIPAGRRGKDGAYPEDSILGRAMAKAFEYWKRVSQHRRIEEAQRAGTDSPAGD